MRKWSSARIDSTDVIRILKHLSIGMVYISFQMKYTNEQGKEKEGKKCRRERTKKGKEEELLLNVYKNVTTRRSHFRLWFIVSCRRRKKIFDTFNILF